jgi:hypothetical protein
MQRTHPHHTSSNHDDGHEKYHVVYLLHFQRLSFLVEVTCLKQEQGTLNDSRADTYQCCSAIQSSSRPDHERTVHSITMKSSHKFLVFLAAVVCALLSYSQFYFLFDHSPDDGADEWTKPIIPVDADSPRTQPKLRPQPRPRPTMEENERKPIMTLALIRSIGNALPPRHKASQTLDNLNFTLHHEANVPNLQKHWLLNRLVDKQVEQQVVDLLTRYDQNYTILPFDLEEYSNLKFDFDLFEPEGILDYVHHPHHFTQNNLLFKQAMEIEKNLYVCNVNGARNTMMEIGRSLGVTWILPWDGNCFITERGLEELIQKLSVETGKYSMTPTHRVVGENVQLLDPNYQREPSEEPMLSFRTDAEARFHPRLWYGRKDKVELLLRMKIPGHWNKANNFSRWEFDKLAPPLLSPLLDVGDAGVPKVGWAFRLNSGNPRLETQLGMRGVTRTQGVTLMLTNLDVLAATKLHNFSSNTLLFYNKDALAQDRNLFDSRDPEIASLQTQLLAVAEHSLTVGPWSVREKPKSNCAPSNDCGDYYSPHPHLWPLKDGTYERRDAEIVPRARLYGKLSLPYDRTRLVSMQYNITVLALAFAMTGEMKYASHAAEAVRTWFIKNETMMNPNMNYAQVEPSAKAKTGHSEGVMEMRDVYFMLDAVRMLHQSGALTGADQVALQAWFQRYLVWLENSIQGKKEYLANNSNGVLYDIQVVAVAAFVNDTKTMLWYLDRSFSRLKSQVHKTGALQHELRRGNCEHYQLVALQGWFTLARLGKVVGRNLWEAYPSTVDGMELSALCRAAYFSIPYFSNREECPENKRSENGKRWLPLLSEAQSNCPGIVQPVLEDANLTPSVFRVEFETSPSESHYSMPSIFHPDDGIAPFWNLGLPID